MVTNTSSSRGYRLKPGLATSAICSVESVITGSHINAVGKPMKVTIHLLPTRKEKKVVELDKGASVEQAIRALGLIPDAWIPVRGNLPLPLDEPLKDGDVLKLISVISGG